ncbi:MAG: hypothetical protein JXA10_03995 [Anaerolineae bacterium]|nr:hypothetical protein [Anaerolineae bacterium]
MADPHVFWSQLLSRDVEKIRAAWDSLAADEKTAVHVHLTNMVTEDDWTEPQRVSAQAALDALKDWPASSAE